MFRAAVLIFLLAPVCAGAQAPHPCPAGWRHAACHSLMHAPAPIATALPAPATAPAQLGQSAFAAIQEIVEILQADPKTDWSKVNIDALRQHLVDMNSVMLAATVRSVATDDGIRFEATGDGPLRDSIRRMVLAHAATMNGAGPWIYEASEIDGGAALTVHVQPQDREKLRGLGFFGVLTLGVHHQMHHMMIARGENPHP